MKLYVLKRSLLIGAAALFLGTSAAFAQAGPTGPTGVSADTFCSGLAQQLGGIPIPNNDVCDVVVVRKSPVIQGHDGMNLNKFTLMNSVLEFTRTGQPANQVYVMGDFALLETEMNDVLDVVTNHNWTVTGIHNHMIMESPKMTFIHWETRGNTNAVVNQINQAFAQTSIK